MSRMHSGSKGKSKSTKPAGNKAPSWVELKPKEIIEQMELILGYSSMGIPNFIQKAALPSLNKDWEVNHLRDLLGSLHKQRDYAVKRFNELPGVNCTNPEGTNLTLPEISGLGMTSMDVAKMVLEKAKVAIAPGSAYHAERHIRFSLGPPETNEAVDRICDVLSKLGSG